jgi:hypothetical protein
VQV